MDGPALSYRMNMLRDGLEDWEMFLVGVDLGAEDYVRAQVDRAYTQFGAHCVDGSYDIENPPWAIDDRVMMDARRNVGRKIQHLLQPELYPDPEDPPAPVEPVAEPVAEPMTEAEPEAVTEPGTEAVTEAVAAQDVAAPETSPADIGGAPEIAPTPAAGGGDSGGSGCAAGRGPAGAPWLLLLALLVVARRSRVGYSAPPSTCATTRRISAV